MQPGPSCRRQLEEKTNRSCRDSPPSCLSHRAALNFPISDAPPGDNGQSSRAAVETERRTLVKLGPGRKFQAKSSGWDENLMFLEGEAVGDGRSVLTHVPAGPRPAPPPAEHYFPTEK
jgi:hypothetical protein